MANFKLNLVLASASPRRRELLGHLGIPFEVKTFNGPEESSHTNPVEFCREIAQIKGQAVARDFKANRSDENFYIVSSDTIVCLDEKIYGKPSDVKEAQTYLSELSGKTHSVYTAVSMRLLKDGIEFETSFVEESLVSFCHINKELMDLYLATGDSLDKAGAYGIQGPSLTFISKVEGSYSNVVGFPLSQFVLETETFLQKHFFNEASWFNLFR